MGEKGLLLVFYRGSFCPYCAGQLASVNEYISSLHGTGVNVVAVSADKVSESRALSRQLDLDFPLLSDSKRSAINLFAVSETKKGPSYPPGISKPAIFLLNKRGDIRYSYVGRDAYDGHGLRSWSRLHGSSGNWIRSARRRHM